jgi:L-fuculose-phosphate aldolase
MTSPSSNDIRCRIAAARRMLYRNGCDSGVGGHVSARAADGTTFWVSPFEYFDETTPDRVIRVDFDLQLLEGDWEASPAIRFHAEIYRRRMDVNAVIHTHSKWALVQSTLGVPLGMYDSEATVFFEEQAVFEENTPNIVSAADLAESLEDGRLLILKNHGAIIASQSLEEATVEAMMLEGTAFTHVHAVMIGGSEYHRDAVRALKAGYRTNYVPQMWIANMRRLRQSDPDLFEQGQLGG